MANIEIAKLDIKPFFDMELFMATSQETRVGGAVMDQLEVFWEEWLPHANAVTVSTKSGSYLVVWLDEKVENTIDAAWDETPSEGFMYNALAQVMCMGLVHEAVPQVEEAGCAPAPKRTNDLIDALNEVGIPYSGIVGQTLERRYAVVTHYPFKGGCEVCSLFEQCPKGNGGGSITLPGHQKK